jgi:3-oxoacyl-[acyl-carrier-protein] synthase-3
MTRGPTPARPRGVRIVGSGSCLPQRVLTNADLTTMMDTSDEWIVQRTGIHERRIASAERGETLSRLAAAALRGALADARTSPDDLDLLVLASITQEMMCPPGACLVASLVGASRCGAFDVGAACSGFVYALNIAHELVRGGSYGTVGVIGADILSKHVDYSTAGRGTAILFGDAAAALILRATDDPARGLVAHAMRAQPGSWADIFIPNSPADFPDPSQYDPAKIGRLQMNGRAVFRFAVETFSDLIGSTLAHAGVEAADVDLFVCHQSNARILEAARQRFGLPRDKLYVNINRVGNTVAASVPLCFDELRRAGRVREGTLVMFVAFGGGLTWASSLWRM